MRIIWQACALLPVPFLWVTAVGIRMMFAAYYKVCAVNWKKSKGLLLARSLLVRGVLATARSVVGGGGKFVECVRAVLRGCAYHLAGMCSSVRAGLFIMWQACLLCCADTLEQVGALIMWQVCARCCRDALDWYHLAGACSAPRDVHGNFTPPSLRPRRQCVFLVAAVVTISPAPPRPESRFVLRVLTNTTPFGRWLMGLGRCPCDWQSPGVSNRQSSLPPRQRGHRRPLHPRGCGAQVFAEVSQGPNGTRNGEVCLDNQPLVFTH